MSELRRRALNGAGGGLLPHGYSQVQYIKSTGTQFINTGVAPSTLISYSIDFAFDPAPNNSKYCLIGGTGTLGQVKYSFVAYTYSGNTMIGAGVEKQTGLVPSTQRHLYLIHNLSDKLSYIDNVAYSGSYAAVFTSNGRSMYLLNTNHESTIPAFSPCAGYLYGSVIIQSGAEIRDFVPCIRKADNNVGMYDLCGSASPFDGTPFYGNSGTGAFIPGPNVE